MLVLVWSLLAAQTASSLILPHQQLVKHQKGGNQRLAKHQKETSHQEMFSSPSSQHYQTSFTFVPKQQAGDQKATQRSFQLLPNKVAAFQHQNLHNEQELNHPWNQKRMLMFDQDEQQRSMQLTESLVPLQANISVAQENIEAAMVKKVAPPKMGKIPGKAYCSHTIQS